MALNKLKVTNWLLKFWKVSLPVIVPVYFKRYKKQLTSAIQILFFFSFFCYHTFLLKPHWFWLFFHLYANLVMYAARWSQRRPVGLPSLWWLIESLMVALEPEEGRQGTRKQALSPAVSAPAWIRGLHQMVDLALPHGCRETQSLRLKMVCCPSNVSEAHWQSV